MNFETMTDEQLIQMLRDGKNEITDYLMEKYKNMVKMHAKEMYLLGGERDDLIQEGMIGLFKAIRDFDENSKASFSSFANLCVTRQMYSAIKASQRKKHMPLNSYISLYSMESQGENGGSIPLAEMIEAGSDSDPEARLMGREYENQFKERLDERLSKLEQRVLYLHLMGMDYRKIAEVMDKSPKTIDNALQRIKTKAREIQERI